MRKILAILLLSSVGIATSKHYYKNLVIDDELITEAEQDQANQNIPQLVPDSWDWRT